MVKCDYMNFTKEAVVKGYVYDTSTNGSGEQVPVPIIACDDHGILDSFAEDTKIIIEMER